MEFRSLKLAALGSALLMSAFAGQAQAEDSTMPGTLTGGVSINSDYMSRGISQTANSAAVMGWLDWAFDTGYEGTSVYVGGFAANVDFPGTDANLETDATAGIRGSLSGVDLDLGVAYYAYHGAPSSLNLDYYEIILRPSHDFGFAKLSGQINYSPDYSGKTGNGLYVNGRADVPLGYDISVFGTMGHQWIEDNALATLPDYTDWSLGISRPFWKFNVTATYTDTNLSKSECYAQAYGNVCSARGVVSVGVAF